MNPIDPSSNPEKGEEKSIPIDDSAEKSKRKIERIASENITAQKKPKNLKIDIPPEAYSSQQITNLLTALEVETRYNYVKSFKNNVNEPIIQFFYKNYPGQEVAFGDVAEGVTDTKIVTIQGTPCYVLKKVSLPETFFSREILQNVTSFFNKSEKKELKEKAKELFIEHPSIWLNTKFPYVVAAQREKLAYIIGKELGVPKTILLSDDQGIYSLHSYIPKTTSARKFKLDQQQEKIDLQSLQNIAILDLLIDNQDRNAGNILVLEKDNSLVLIPVDHALTLQQAENYKQLVAMRLEGAAVGITYPCWYDFKKINAPLTEKTKKFIDDFDPNTALSLAKKTLVLEEKTERVIIANSSQLKEIICSPHILTLKDLVVTFFDVKSSLTNNEEK